MAGERLVQLIKGNVKQDNNIIFGTVTSISPLNIKVGDRQIPPELIYLSTYCKQLKIRYKDDDITVWNGVKTGDTVVIIESNNNQLYFVLEVVK